jgi:hypothetical protein
VRELGTINRYHCWSRLGFSAHRRSDHDRLKCRYGEIRVSVFFTFRQSDVVLVGVQDPVILHSVDDNMQYIVIIGCFDEFMPTLAIQPSPWITNAKNRTFRLIVAILKPCREILIGRTIEIAKKT